MANRLISAISGVPLHDYGCSLKAYRRDVMMDVKLYGEMHRFIPIYARWAGARVTEIPVTHHPRNAGVSKYGLSRTVKVLFDLITIKFMSSYLTMPRHIVRLVHDRDLLQAGPLGPPQPHAPGDPRDDNVRHGLSIHLHGPARGDDRPHLSRVSE
jgi:hypothetical protein